MHAREEDGDAWQERLSPVFLQRSKKTNEFACTRMNSESHRPHGCRVNSESPFLAGDTGICKEYARTREIRVIQSAGIEHRRVGGISGFVSVTRQLLVRPHRWGRDVGRHRAVPDVLSGSELCTVSWLEDFLLSLSGAWCFFFGAFVVVPVATRVLRGREAYGPES